MEINASLLGQLITFGILVWFIMKYVWPPVTTAMHEREKKISAGLESAERGKRELEMAEKKVLTLIQAAKVDAAQIIDQAHKRSVELIDQAKNDARDESARIIEHAQEEILREITQAKEGMRKQLAVLAVAGAEKILQRNLDASAQTTLLDEFVAEI